MNRKIVDGILWNARYENIKHFLKIYLLLLGYSLKILNTIYLNYISLKNNSQKRKKNIYSRRNIYFILFISEFSLEYKNVKKYILNQEKAHKNLHNIKFSYSSFNCSNY